MAAITSAVVVAAGSAYAANRQGAAAEKAADAQGDAARDANMQAQQNRDQSRLDQQPFYEAGTGALNQLAALNSGDYSGFENNPDYLYQRGQIQQGVERGAASQGRLFSGGTNIDLATALNGVASQNLGAYRSSLMGLAGVGQNSAGAMNNIGANYTNQYARNTYDAGQARASGYLAQGATQAGYANALASGLGAYAGGGGTFGMGGGTGAGANAWGSFAPQQQQQQPNYTAYNGSSAFGGWGQGWGG